MTGINLIRVVLASSLILLSGSVFAEKLPQNTQEAGKILLSVGDVYSLRNEKKVLLKRRSKVFEQDEIHVGKGARTQIRMIDSALISLQENSVLKIKNYRYQKDNKGNSALLELLSGGLRTITGKIGKSNKKAYELRTPLATIGIRGTDYEVKVVEDGLYVGVWEGGIDLHSLMSDNSNLVIGSEHEFSFVFINTEGDIKGLETAPTVFSSDHGNATSSPPSSSSTSSPTSSAASTSSATLTPLAPLAPLATILPDPEATSVNSFNALAVNPTNPSGVINANTTSVNSTTPILNIDGTAVNTNSDTSNFSQSIGGYEMSWGHWSGFTSTTNGTSTASNADLIWSTYQPSPTDIVSAKTGAVSYDHVIDSITSGSQGNVTNLDVNMDVNFDSGAITNGVISANATSDTWIGLFDGQVQNGDLNLQMNDASVINADPLATTVDVRDASGSINGDFIGDQAQGVIGAFELSEDNNASNHIEGVFVVEPQ